MTRLHRNVSILGLAVACFGCNARFNFDVPDASLSAASGGSTTAGGFGGSNAGGQSPGGTGVTGGASGVDAGTLAACTARCANYGQLCAPDWLACVECNQDSDWSGAGKRRCWLEDHRCVACATNVDCATGQLCASQFGECRTACNHAASMDDVCAADNERCSDINICIVCSTDAECTSKGLGLHCLPGTGYCVACTSNSDCSGATPYCDTVAHSCVVCTDGRQCASGACDIANHRCY